MSRPLRIRLAGYPQHVVQRGNDRRRTFFAAGDFRLYRHFLGAAAARHECAIHAYCLMPNHVHLLVTPASPDGIAKLMQCTAQRYVQHVNKTYERTGTLWEGRYKAGLVDTGRYLLACYAYIELNPVRANIVNDPARYEMSSYARNALARDDPLVTEHPEYTVLADSLRVRARRYRDMLACQLDTRTIESIRRSARRCAVYGSARFAAEIERILHRERPGRGQRRGGGQTPGSDAEGSDPGV